METFVKRILIAVFAVLLIAAPVAAKSSVTISDTSPAYGDTITMAISGNAGSSRILCYQGGVLVFYGAPPVGAGGPVLLGGPTLAPIIPTPRVAPFYTSLNWTSGGADCVAQAINYRDQRGGGYAAVQIVASLAFTVLP